MRIFCSGYWFSSNTSGVCNTFYDGLLPVSQSELDTVQEALRQEVIKANSDFAQDPNLTCILLNMVVVKQ